MTSCKQSPARPASLGRWPGGRLFTTLRASVLCSALQTFRALRSMFATLHAGIGVKQTHSYARSLKNIFGRVQNRRNAKHLFLNIVITHTHTPPHMNDMPPELILAYAQYTDRGLRGSRVERGAPCYRIRPPPHRTVRAVFPHTALRAEVCIHRSRSPNLFRIVSLWSRRHRSTWTSSLRLAASSADCPSLDVPFPFVIHPLMFYQYSCEL